MFTKGFTMQAILDYEEVSKRLQREMLLDFKTIALVKEYSAIASQPRLSEADANRLAEIIRLAEDNGCLEFWINEVDHFLAHELEFQTGQTIYPFETENQKIVLSEHLSLWTQKIEEIEKSDGAAELLEEIHEFLQSGNADVQTKLRDCGFDPGPIDGVVGDRTQAAIKQFQRAHRLPENGQLDPDTQCALGYR